MLVLTDSQFRGRKLQNVLAGSQAFCTDRDLPILIHHALTDDLYDSSESIIDLYRSIGSSMILRTVISEGILVPFPGAMVCLGLSARMIPVIGLNNDPAVYP